MSLAHLPEISGSLRILPFERSHEAGFALVRTDTEPTVEVALVNDGADRGIGEAEQYAQLFACAPLMLGLLREALAVWSEQFDALDDSDDDTSVSGGDLLDWFAGWRSRVRDRLGRPVAEPDP